MSDKCEHNNHSHFLLWMFVVSLCFHSSCVDCTGESQRMKNEISDLYSKDKRLENEVSSLASSKEYLERKLRDQEETNQQFQFQLEKIKVTCTGLKQGYK